MEELTKAGLITDAGEKAFQLRKEHKSAVYSHENETAMLSPEFEKQFKANKKAWEFFNNQAPSYKKFMLHWIMRAKQEKTRLSRLEKTIKESEAGKRIL
jgi:uncharacterized protein YdeI (YjbR/CyaY-like superfamily)